MADEQSENITDSGPSSGGTRDNFTTSTMIDAGNIEKAFREIGGGVNNPSIILDPGAATKQQFDAALSMERREIELLKREKEVLKQELELTKRQFSSLQFNNTNLGGASSCFSNADLVSLVPEFDPAARPAITAKAWVRSVDNLKVIYNMSDQMTLLATSSKLKGAAKFWLLSRGTNIVTWEQLRQDICLAFPSYSDEADVHMSLMKRKKQPAESIEVYFYEMLAIAAKANLSTQSITKYIVNGLDDDDLRKGLSLQRCENPDELLQQIKWYQEVQLFSGKRPRDGHDSRVGDSNNYSTADKRVLKKIKCYNCDQLGHISRECPSPQKQKRCRVCNKVGHTEADCKQARRASVSWIAADDFEKKVVLDGRFYTMGVVDSGSDVTLVRSSVVRAMQLSLQNCKVPLQGFAKGKCCTLGKFVAQLKVDEAVAAVDMHAVDDELLSRPILIGKNFLNLPNVELSKIEGTYRIFNTSNESLAKTEELNNKRETEQLTGLDNKCEIINRVNICHEAELFTVRAEKPTRETIRKEDVNRGVLNDEQSEKLLELLNEFRNCFAMNILELGCAVSYEMDISLRCSDPIGSRPYRLAYSQRTTINKIVQELLKAEIIQPSNSPYTSPALLVKKKDGEDRMVIDYRRLNATVIRDKHPLPLIEDLLLQLQGATMFIGLDLASGYYQIPVSKASRKYTAFVTPDGEYEFRRMPFGLSNGPSCFQRMMSDIQRRMTTGRLLVYLDDVLIPCRNFDEGMKILREFLEIISKEGLTLKLKKSFFFEEQLEFLGYDINTQGIRPNERKIAAVRNFPKPQNLHELRQFLGLTSYFRKFVPNNALIAQPLTALTRKDVQFSWTHEQEAAFEKLKNILTTRPLLTLYDPEREHELHTDASSLGVAGILLQRDLDSELRPVAYFSRQTTDLERNYHGYELETLAVVESVARFRAYLLGKHFRIITDCESLKATLNKKNIIPRIARWFLRLMEYDFEIEYRRGNSVSHVDCLSRNPHDKPSECEVVGFQVFPVEIDSEDWLMTMQLQDPKLKHIVQILKRKPMNNEEEAIHQNYTVERNRLYRKQENDLRWVVPSSALGRIIRSCHDDVGHYGLDRTLELLKRDYWFPKMRRKLKNYIASCIECAYHRRPSGKPEGELHPIPKIPTPFHTVHVDHLGPFPKSTGGCTHVLGIVDGFTKYVILKPVRNTSSQLVIKAFNEIFKYFGTPVRLVTDRGAAFTSKSFIDFCNNNNINHILTAARTPRANGQIERCNRTILHALSTMSSNPAQWDKHLHAIQWGINSCTNDTTKQSPHALLFGFQPRDSLGNKVLLALHSNDPVANDLEALRRDVASVIEKSQLYQKTRFDMKHSPPKGYSVGDLILIERPSISTGDSRKLDPKYKGPYIVTKVLEHDRYVIEDIPGAQRTQRRFNSIYSSDNMKRWCDGFNEELVDDDDNYESDELTNDGIEDDSDCQDGRAVTKRSAASAYEKQLTKPLHLNIGSSDSIYKEKGSVEQKSFRPKD